MFVGPKVKSWMPPIRLRVSLQLGLGYFMRGCVAFVCADLESRYIIGHETSYGCWCLENISRKTLVLVLRGSALPGILFCLQLFSVRELCQWTCQQKQNSGEISYLSFAKWFYGGRTYPSGWCSPPNQKLPALLEEIRINNFEADRRIKVRSKTKWLEINSATWVFNIKLLVLLSLWSGRENRMT